MSMPSRAPAQTGQQREAVAAIRAWYQDGSSDQVFRLFGFAGTGKTTLARQVADELGIANSTRYAAYTGKAAYVLRQKGCADASTIHSLIYVPTEKAREHLRELKALLKAATTADERAVLERKIRKEEEDLRTPDFILNMDSDLGSADMLILDEVSMVSSDMAYDLMSFGVRMLVLGDPAQLPPVAGEGHFMRATPDRLLTEIHRSAIDSPVTRLSMAVREAPASGPRTLGIEGMDGESGRTDVITRDELMGFDQVLVGTNNSRWRVVRTVRNILGRPEGTPVPNDRIIVLANNSTVGVFNGQQFTVDQAEPDKKLKGRFQIHATDDAGQSKTLRVWASGFEGADGERLARAKAATGDVAATFAQAITTHKAQGSQWGSVLVLDETSSFYGRTYHEHKAAVGTREAHRLAQEVARPWLYTAVTRAAQRVVVAPPAGVAA